MLTDNQIRMLKACADEPQSSWEYGSATVSALRKLGLIVPKLLVRMSGSYTVNEITAAGREALKGVC